MTPEEQQRLNRLLTEEAQIRRDIANDSSEFITLLKKIKGINENIVFLEKLKKNASADEAQILQEKIDLAKQNLATYKKIAKETDNISKGLAVANSSLKTMKSIGGTITGIYGTIVSQTKFITDIDKKIKMSALSMGILDTQTKSFRKSLANASAITNDFGINQGQLAEMQAAYSQELGRTVMLGTEGLVAIAEMAAATGLGAEGAAKMSADFELIGYSAEKTSDFIEQTMNDSSKMGLNASKVVKAMSNGMKLLNKYNFKGGVAGLKKMAETTTKLGVDMSFVTGMADKLFDIEGAVQMSAELQVLGGSFARLADPFHLMFMARNDVAGLTEEIGKAAEEFVSFNAETGNFDISAMGMQQLRKIAEQTGLEFESLVTAGKNASKFTMIESQVSFNMDDKDREFLANTAQLDEKGRAYIEVNGEKKFLDMLGAEGDKFIKTQIAEKKTLADRAKASLTFDEKITNFINKIKELFLPLMPVLDAFAEALVTSLEPAFKDLKATIGSKEFQDGIKDFATGAIEVAKTVGGLITWFIKNPGMGLAAIGLLEAGKWYLMGVSFGGGFNSVAGFKNLMGRIGAAAVLGTLKDVFDFASDEKTRNTGTSGFLESLGGSGMSLIDWIPGLNQVTEGIGLGVDNMGTDNLANARAIYRSKYPSSPTVIPNKDLFSDIKNNPNSYTSDIVDDAKDVTINDGIIRFNPKDKFMKVDDATMIAGTNAGGNRALANQLSSNGEIKHTFDDIKIKGEIQITTPSGKEIPNELIKDPYFIKNITRLINIELEKVKNGNILSPS
jgi:hypothetical protein